MVWDADSQFLAMLLYTTRGTAIILAMPDGHIFYTTREQMRDSSDDDIASTIALYDSLPSKGHPLRPHQIDELQRLRAEMDYRHKFAASRHAKRFTDEEERLMGEMYAASKLRSDLWFRFHEKENSARDVRERSTEFLESFAIVLMCVFVLLILGYCSRQ